MENLGIDPKLLLAQVINFLVFFILIKKFILKPFMQFLDHEKKQEKDKADALAQIKKQEEQVIEQEKKLKERARHELDLALEQAKKDGLQLREDIIEEAKKDAEEVRARMKKQMEEEKQVIYKEVRQKIAEVSMELVTEGLKDALDAETKKKVTTRILKNIEGKQIVSN